MSTPTISAQRLTCGEAETLWRGWKEYGDRRSCDRLVLSYAPLVRYLANRKIRELPSHQIRTEIRGKLGVQLVAYEGVPGRVASRWLI